MGFSLSDGISVVAVVVSTGAVLFTKRATDLASAKDRRERTPSLTFTLSAPQPAPIDSAIYRVHNDGPEDLTSIIVHRPIAPGAEGIIYPVAVTADGHWHDEVDLGPLSIGDGNRMTLCCGSEMVPPEFEVVIDCVGKNLKRDRWTITRVLPPPRGPVE